jgi:hypothetical protein
MFRLPDFRIEIPDRDAADFWLDEFQTRWHQTNDHAFKEQADAMETYIANHWIQLEEHHDQT